MKRLLLVTSLAAICATTCHAETKMRDVLVQAADAVSPILTRNNVLDCIDFIENKMQAKVKNRFDEWSELTLLTDHSFKMKLNASHLLEGTLINDSLLYLVNTYFGPTADSEVTLVDARTWKQKAIIARPNVNEFLPTDIDPDAAGWLKTLPLMKATISYDKKAVVWELQTDELTKELKEAATGKLKVVEKTLGKQ